jgi:hypothetical protein
MPAVQLKSKRMHTNFHSVEEFLSLDLFWLADWVIDVWDLRRAKPVIRY